MPTMRVSPILFAFLLTVSILTSAIREDQNTRDRPVSIGLKAHGTSMRSQSSERHDLYLHLHQLLWYVACG